MMLNAGKYDKRITIFKEVECKTENGFVETKQETVLNTYACVKTTKGFTLIANNSDFEKAYTNFTIRFPKTPIERHFKIKFNNKIYSIEYLNNIDENNVELEIQAKEVRSDG